MIDIALVVRPHRVVSAVLASICPTRRASEPHPGVVGRRALGGCELATALVATPAVRCLVSQSRRPVLHTSFIPAKPALRQHRTMKATPLKCERSANINKGRARSARTWRSYDVCASGRGV
jgi:hypothetical protein